MQNPDSRKSDRGEEDVILYDGVKPMRAQLAQMGELPSTKI